VQYLKWFSLYRYGPRAPNPRAALKRPGIFYFQSSDLFCRPLLFILWQGLGNKFNLDTGYTICYTITMNSPVSIMSEYIQNHKPDIITEKLNSYYESHESHLDDDLKETAYRLFAREEW
jgi:hypothetical protein